MNPEVKPSVSWGDIALVSALIAAWYIFRVIFNLIACAAGFIFGVMGVLVFISWLIS